jgi:hypothetical protein
MAKATKKTVTEITLSLSFEEAAALKYILYRIGGLAGNTPRCYTDAIASALGDVGVPNIDKSFLVSGLQSIHFEPGTLNKFNEALND